MKPFIGRVRRSFVTTDATALLPIFVIALSARVYSLGQWSLWLDETLQYNIASHPIGEFHKTLFPTDMPLHFLLSRFLVFVGFGQNEWQLRFPSALFGAGTALVCYGLGRSLFDRRTAAFTGLIVALMPVLVRYGQEYRSYSFFCFITASTALLLVRALKDDDKSYWAAFVLSSVVMLYTHFVAVFPYAAFAAFAIFAVARNKALARSAVASLAIVGVSYLPALPLIARAHLDEAANKLDGFQAHFDVVPLIFISYTGWPTWAATAVALLALTGIFAAARQRSIAAMFLFCTVAVPAGIFVFVSYTRITMDGRYNVFIYPFYGLAAGAGTSVICRMIGPRHRMNVIGPAIAASFIVLISAAGLTKLYSSNPKPYKVDLRAASQHLRSEVGPDDLLLEASFHGSIYWNGYYRSFYALGAGEIIDDINFPGRAALHARKTGRLHVLSILSDARTAEIANGNSYFRTRCWRQVCLVSSRSNADPMAVQMVTFFDTYKHLDGEYLRLPAAAAAKTTSQID